MAARRRRAPARKKRGSLNHYFVPGAHNDHRPEFLEYQALAINVAIVVLLFLIALGIQSLVFRVPSAQTAAVVASVLVDLANEDRSSENRAMLSVNPVLQKAAQMKADDMAAKSYFAHTSPEGADPWHWFTKAGYDFRFAGENLAVYFSDSLEVEKAWMNSPTHRGNIMSDKFTEVGIALARGSYEGNETTFVVQMFGTPAEAAPTAVVSASTPGADAPIAGASAESVEMIVEDEAFIAVRKENQEPSRQGLDGSLAGVSTAPQPIGAIKGVSPSGNVFMRLLTSPKTTLQYIYMALGGLVLFAISLLFLSGLRRLHVLSLLRGAALFALIGVLFWGSSHLSSTLLIA